jgi:hypothetical protein
MVTIKQKPQTTSTGASESGSGPAVKKGKKSHAAKNSVAAAAAGTAAAQTGMGALFREPKPFGKDTVGRGPLAQSLLPNQHDYQKESQGTQGSPPLGKDLRPAPPAIAAAMTFFANTPKLKQKIGNHTIGEAVSFWSKKLAHDQASLTWVKFQANQAHEGAPRSERAKMAYYRKLTQTDQKFITSAKNASQAVVAASKTIGQADVDLSAKLIHDQNGLLWAESMAGKGKPSVGAPDVAYYQKLVQDDQGALFLTKQAKTAAIKAWGTDKVVLDDKQHPVVLKNGVVTPVGSGELYANGVPRAVDVQQGSISDCYMLASLASLANSSPQTINNNIRSTGQPGIYEVKLFRPDPKGSGAMVPIVETVDAAHVHVMPTFDLLTKKRIIWPALYEQAFAQLQEKNYRDVSGFAKISSGGLARYALPILTGEPVVSTPSTVAGVTAPSDLAAALAAGKPVTVGFSKANAAAGTIELHEYSVLNISSDLKSITLRNPWGSWGGTPTDPTVKLNMDGSATMPMKVFDALVKGEVTIGNPA